MALNYDIENDPKNLAEQLRGAGLKVTAQRLLILAAIDGDRSHPTAQDLFERVRDAHPQLAQVSFATVYNTLSALERVGRVRSLTLGGATRFDPNVVPHDHALCDGCGAMRDVPARPDEHGGGSPPRIKEFSVRRVERIYRGLCAACARRRTDRSS